MAAQEGAATPSTPPPDRERPRPADDVSVAQRLALIREQVDSLAQIAAADLPGSDSLAGSQALALFDAAHELADRLQAVAVKALPVVEAQGWWATGGARTFPSWLARRAHLTSARSKRLVRLGQALRDELRLTAVAVASGGPDRVSTEQAEILVSAAATSARRREVLADPDQPVGERFLLDQASMMSADTLRLVARRWAAAADPEADERGYKDATEREFFDVSPTTGGTHLSGFLTTEHGQALLVALQAVAGVPAADDERTSSQRRAGALSDLARLSLDHGLAGSSATVRPHLSVLVEYPTLMALASAAGVSDPSCHGLPTPGLVDPALIGPGVTDQGLVDPALVSPAVFEDGEAVPRAVLDRLMCDGEVSRVVFGPDSQLLNVGRSRRTFAGQLRRAIVARDKHCQYPSCQAPPRLCEGHHRIHWARDHGDTDATTGVLLCWHHHETVHDDGIEITWKPGGGWEFTDRHGNVLSL
ncbi:HNH endonuclease signature motif containing protein [Pengzhenrongella frigida]|uniref:HNH endonuclease n=1 Tax=Pengzhenrongella frigida TaxID=1259133 RepID=A0A4Q5N4J8_9MICO|nr:HNH endonuclease signature motif containing protein [Cellulomonas sp. HLT2-17]RYV52293.1 HNH endonuclease [Cellulomonas sp. HLT2-17]